MSLRVAYIAAGQLYLKEGNSPARKFESPFGKTLQRQKDETHRQRAWQRKSMMSSMLPPEIAERMQSQEPPPLPVSVASVCTGGDGLFFSLSAGQVGGFLTFDPSRDVERRLFHTAEFQLDHLCHQPELGLVACTILYADGSQHLAVLRDDGARPDQVTEGDAIDMAPRWVPGAGKTVVYQSAGVAHDANGYIRDRAPFSIEKLDLESADVTTLAEDRTFDFMAPRLLADGTLFCIRRPYKPKNNVSFGRALLDAVLIPFRLLFAIFQFLNFFSWRYTGKELTRDVGLAGANGDQKDVKPEGMLAWGEYLTPQTMPRGRNKKVSDDPVAWVPKDWQLLRRAPGGEFETLAESVLAYDIAPDGTVLYTNGGALFSRSPDGNVERLHIHAAMGAVAAY
jgi:hypothetical protein